MAPPITLDDLENVLPALDVYMANRFPKKDTKDPHWYYDGIEIISSNTSDRYLAELTIFIEHIDKWRHIYTYGVTFDPVDEPDGTARTSQWIQAYVTFDGRILPFGPYRQEERALAIAFADYRRTLLASTRQARAAAFWRNSKEELAQMIWHPRQVERLVELIGLDAVMTL